MLVAQVIGLIFESICECHVRYESKSALELTLSIDIFIVKLDQKIMAVIKPEVFSNMKPVSSLPRKNCEVIHQRDYRKERV